MRTGIGRRQPYIPARRPIGADRFDGLVPELLREAMQADLAEVRELRGSVEDNEELKWTITHDPAGGTEIATVHWDPMIAKYGKIGGIVFSENSSNAFRAFVPQLRAKNS
jgi:hypothetical protein